MIAHLRTHYCRRADLRSAPEQRHAALSEVGAQEGLHPSSVCIFTSPARIQEGPTFQSCRTGRSQASRLLRIYDKASTRQRHCLRPLRSLSPLTRKLGDVFTRLGVRNSEECLGPIGPLPGGRRQRVLFRPSLGPG
jgi:hypothetical protein